MASVSARKNANGEVISYQVKVFDGYNADGSRRKPHIATFKPQPGATKRQTEKALNAFVVNFEQQCRAGLVGDSKQKFAVYADYVLNLKESSGDLRTQTLNRYRKLLERCVQAIGHLKLADIRPQHLNAFYEQLSQEGIRKAAEKAVILPDIVLGEIVRQKCGGVDTFLKAAGVANGTYRAALSGKRITAAMARKIAAALEMDVSELFELQTDSRPLSAKTISEHHRLIHMILHQAERELIIMYNPADRATPPKVPHSRAAYFEPETVGAILEAAEMEPLKWKTMLHILLVTGGRRGEVLGLTWDCIDWTFNRIHVEKAVYYDSEKHCVYVDDVKTDSSVRWIKLPEVTMQLLKQYRDEYFLPLKAAAGDKWHETGFIFVKDSGKDIGAVMHPDSVTDFCKKFSDRHELPHIHPHAFRHTAASVLYFAGLDSVSISKMLGHAKVSTTQDIYAHVIQEAENRTAAAMGEIIMRTRKPLKEQGSAEPADKAQTG